MTTWYVDGAAGSDSNAGTSPGSGNAWATLTHAAGVVAAGDLVWIKASASYCETVPIATTAGTESAPITWAGYASTPGDGGQATVDAQNARAACLSVSKGWNIFRCLILTGSTARAVDSAAVTAGVAFYDCQMLRGSGPGTGTAVGTSNYNASPYVVERCLLSGFATSLAFIPGRLVDCEVVNCGPFAVSYGGCPVLRTIFRGGAGPAIQAGAGVANLVVDGCTFHGKTSGSGVQFNTTGYANCRVANCCFTANAAYGLDAPASAGIYADFNAYGSGSGYANTSGARSTIAAGAHDVALASGSPYAADVAGNFAPNATGGLRAAGSPGAFPAGTTTSYRDVGAAQHQDSGGAAGAPAPPVHPPLRSNSWAYVG